MLAHTSVISRFLLEFRLKTIFAVTWHHDKNWTKPLSLTEGSWQFSLITEVTFLSLENRGKASQGFSVKSAQYTPSRYSNSDLHSNSLGPALPTEKETFVFLH